MADTTLYLVFSNPVDGREREFDEWYDNVHIRDVLATPGMVSARRYTLHETPLNETMGALSHRYLVVYEMADDPAAVMGRIREAVASGQMKMHDALDLSSVQTSYWAPYGPLLHA